MGKSQFFVISGKAQGTTFTIRYEAADSIVSKVDIDSIFRSIDASLSLYKEGSLINRFNSENGVLMDLHLRRVVDASIQAFHQSGGTFDITVRNLGMLWKRDAKPTRRKIRRMMKLTGSDLLEIRGDSLVAVRKGVQIDCNGIAQGYSVDLIHDFLLSKGLKNFLVELGGEIRMKGQGAGGGGWKVGIESPVEIGAGRYMTDKVITLYDQAVTTSGNYRQPGHIIDPFSGRPVRNEMISVTVVTSDATTADAWDNAFFVMGWKAALDYAGKDRSMEIYMVYTDHEGKYRDTSTPGFLKLLR